MQLLVVLQAVVFRNTNLGTGWYNIIIFYMVTMELKKQKLKLAQSRNHSCELFVKVPHCLDPAIWNVYMLALPKVLPNVLHTRIHPGVTKWSPLKDFSIRQSRVHMTTVPQVAWDTPAAFPQGLETTSKPFRVAPGKASRAR